MTKNKFSKVAWNKGMKGFKHSGSFKKGRVVPKEIRDKISKSNRGKPKPLVSKALKGRHLSPSTEFKKGETRGHPYRFPKGNIPWNTRVDKQLVIDLYNKNNSVEDIYKYINCSIGTIYYILKGNNIKLRPRESGPNSANWKGGKSFEPYPINFNKKFKKLIRDRDKYSCMKCYIFEEDHKIISGDVLSVHHIDYIKQNTLKENCCTLCRRCNAEVNYNRNHWTKFFQSLLSEKYSYNYNQNGEIIINISK